MVHFFSLPFCLNAKNIRGQARQRNLVLPRRGKNNHEIPFSIVHTCNPVPLPVPGDISHRERKPMRRLLCSPTQRTYNCNYLFVTQPIPLSSFYVPQCFLDLPLLKIVHNLPRPVTPLSEGDQPSGLARTKCGEVPAAFGQREKVLGFVLIGVDSYFSATHNFSCFLEKLRYCI